MMNNKIYNYNAVSVLVVLVAVSMAAGCGKKEKPETTGESVEQSESVVSTPAESKSSKSIKDISNIPGASVQDPAAQPEVLPSPFRVGAIIDRGDGVISAGLVNKLSGLQKMVVVGDTFENYSVEEIDNYVGVVFLMMNGQRYVAKMEDSPAIDSNPVAVMNSRPELTAQNVMTGSDMFTQTEDELRRGIDPNDPSTWPADYRGPAIERAVIAPTTYEQTPAEMSRGIDPNDPSTWPSDYRGPGIERAAIEIEKFVPTEDEAARGIDPNDASTWPKGYRGPGIERAMMNQTQLK